MTPKFAQAVDPIFLHVLDLHERNERQEPSEAREEHLRINALLDQAEAILGTGQDWELAKYAIVSWIDELLVDTPWSGRDWWSNNVLEVQHFNTRLCNEQFFVRAQEASTLTKRDALEVYYICVVMGFQGLYRDTAMADSLIHGHGLAPDLASWAQQASMSIRLGQGRPPLKPPQREIAGAPPLRSKSMVVWSWLLATVLVVCNIVYFYFRFPNA